MTLLHRIVNRRLQRAPNRQVRPDPPPPDGSPDPVRDRETDPNAGSPPRRPRKTGTSRRREGGFVTARKREAGFVTAEMAAALPAVVAVLALGLWAVSAVGMKVRAIDAANSAAIAAARGEDPQAVAAAYLPDGASVVVSSDGSVARAVVTSPVRPLGPLTPPMEISAEAAAPMEPGLT